MVHQKQFAVCCFIKEDEVGGTWNFFWRVIIEVLWRAFVRNLEVKNFVWS